MCDEIRPLRVGLVGAGWIMPQHLAGWCAAGAQVVAIAEPDAAARRKISEEYGIRKQFDDFHALLACAEIEAVDIAIPTYLHAEVAEEAARAGKHVLCEKPMARTARECSRMIEAARQTRVFLMPLHNRVFFPSIRTAKAIIQDGDIGEPRFFRGSFLTGHYPRGNWRGDPELSGGGVAIEAGVHLIYTAEHLVGRIASVNAQTAQFVQEGLPIEDAVVIDLRFTCGAMGVITLAYGCAYPDDGCQVIGSEGAILVNGVELQAFRRPPLQVYRHKDKSWRAPHIDWNWPRSFIGTITHFVHCVRGEEDPIITPQDGLSAISVVEAIYHSAREGKRVEVQQRRISE